MMTNLKQLLMAATLVLAATTLMPVASAEAAPEEPVDCHGPLDGYQYCEVEIGRCHAGEELFQGDFHAHAECQPNDGKSRCGIDVYASPLLITRHCGSTYNTVWPVTLASPGKCTEHPGYRQCDYSAADCTVSIYYIYHEASYAIEPTCDLPAIKAGGAEVDACHKHPGYEHCEYKVGPCTLDTYYYYHAAFYVIEPDCQKPRGANASDDAAAPCDDLPGYRLCRVDLGICDAEVRYYYHDAFYVVGANCYGKNSTCSYYSYPVYGHQAGLNCKEYIDELITDSSR